MHKKNLYKEKDAYMDFLKNLTLIIIENMFLSLVLITLLYIHYILTKADA